MGLYNCLFSFDGKMSEEYDLTLSSVDGSSGMGESNVAGVSSIIEETLSNRWKPLFYGTALEDKLEFDISIGLTAERYDEMRPLSRAEVAKISAWLVGHDTYKDLVIYDGDLGNYTFKCIVSELSLTGNGCDVWGLTASVTCDSSFAYMKKQNITVISTTEGTECVIQNESCLNRYYSPIVILELDNGGDFEIINLTDGGRSFLFTGIPAAASTVIIDNENLVITNSADLNLYKNFNYRFLRLLPGTNELVVKGNGAVTFICEYPVNIGGYIS